MRTIAVLALAALLAPASAQEKKETPEPVVYRVEFVIRDAGDAAAKAGRRYVMLTDTGGRSAIRIGTRVPYVAGTSQQVPQYQFLETGVNINCSLREAGAKVALNAELEISLVVQHDKGPAASPPPPTIAQVRISVNASLNPGKPALVASIDDPVSMRKFDVEASATKIN
ncbi:MAG: hypothetical protein HY822_22355 [Acidobacteria bacterium]|nr:hypothetical protein [Acidobacteriota bacterium]